MIQSGRIGTGCTFDPEQKNQSNVFYEIHVVFTLRPSLMYCLSETMEVLQVGEFVEDITSWFVDKYSYCQCADVLLNTFVE